jgi:integrase
MPTVSTKGNVTKRCPCPYKQQSTCSHPWYYYTGTGVGRKRGNLDKLIGRHAPDRTTAQLEARRAIAAFAEGQDPGVVLAADDPTIAQLLEAYVRERPRADRWQVPALCRVPLRSPVGLPTFGAWRAREVTLDALKRLRQNRPLVAGNRDLNLLRAAFNWGILGGLVAATPFSKAGVPTLPKRPEVARTRRLQPGEAEALMAAASDDFADVLLAALDTGARYSELTSMQWHQVAFAPRAELFFPAPKTKTKRDRRVPMTPAVTAMLERRRYDPAGQVFPPSAYVFGAVGRRVSSHKRAWLAVVLRAHGQTPQYVTMHKPYRRTGNLTPPCRAALRTIDLHFHDLRREAGSRWMDAGVPLGTIQRWLGHTNIAQTSTYLGASLGDDARDMAHYVEQRNAAQGRGSTKSVAFCGTLSGIDAQTGPRSSDQ